MRSLAVRTALFLAVSALPLCAQRRIEPPDYEQPDRSAVVLGGNGLRQTVSCNSGNAVYVQGQANQVQVGGSCRFVRIQGNRNHVFVQGKSATSEARPIPCRCNRPDRH